MNDYEHIAGVIRYLEERHPEQPDLSALAEHLGLGVRISPVQEIPRTRGRG